MLCFDVLLGNICENFRFLWKLTHENERNLRTCLLWKCVTRVQTVNEHERVWMWNASEWRLEPHLEQVFSHHVFKTNRDKRSAIKLLSHSTREFLALTERPTQTNVWSRESVEKIRKATRENALCETKFRNKKKREKEKQNRQTMLKKTFSLIWSAFRKRLKFSSSGSHSVAFTYSEK